MRATNGRPYKVRRNTVVRCKSGFLRTLDIGNLNMRIRVRLNAPPKEHAWR